MNQAEQVIGSRESNELQNARIGYHIATNLSNTEVQMLWSKFNALLVANSIILYTADKMKDNTTLFSRIIPLFGIILCILWFALLKRSWHQHTYFIKAAREIEETFLSDSVTTLSRGDKVSEGDEVKFRFKERDEPFRIPFLGSLKVKNLSYIIVGIFFFLYIVLLIDTYFKGGESMWTKWMQAVTVILALVGTYFLAFGLRVRGSVSNDLRRESKIPENLIDPSSVRPRNGLIVLGLGLITLAAGIQIWIIICG